MDLSTHAAGHRRKGFVQALIASTFLYICRRAFLYLSAGHRLGLRAIGRLTNFIFWLAMGLIILEVFDVPLTSVLVPVGTVVALSFAFGPAISDTIQGLVWCLATQPFDIGDKMSAAMGRFWDCAAYYVCRCALSLSWRRHDCLLHCSTPLIRCRSSWANLAPTAPQTTHQPTALWTWAS